MKLEFLKKLNAKGDRHCGCRCGFCDRRRHRHRAGSHFPGSGKPEFSEQEAKAAAFSHAGVSEQDVLSLRIDKGMENGSPVYEIDFTTAEKSYDYDIMRSSGEILHSSYDVLGAEIPKAKEETRESSSQAEASSSSPAFSSPSESGSSASNPTAAPHPRQRKLPPLHPRPRSPATIPPPPLPRIRPKALP